MSLARVRALAVLGVLVLIALVSVVWAIVGDDQGPAKTASACGSIDAKKQVAVPPPKSVRLRIYNATDRGGLARQVGAQFSRRGFTVIKTDNDPQREVVTGTAQLRYGPAGAGAAQLLRAYVIKAQPVIDDRTDATVDLVIGASYTDKDITPANQIKAQLERLGPPPTPSVSC